MIRSHIAFLLTVILLLLVSCATTSNVDRGSLSDAMEKARDDYPEEREVPSEPKGDPWDTENENDRGSGKNDSPEEYEESEGTIHAASPEPTYLGVRGGNAFYSYPYFDSLFDAEVLLGTGAARGEMLFFGGIKAVTAREDSEIKESIDDGVLFLRAGVEGRYYPLPDRPVLSPYLLAQAGGLYMYWSFRNPLDAGGETIISDSVAGIFLAAGGGVNLINTELFRLGFAWIPEIYLFYSETKKGFTNDVFDSYSAVRWSLEMGLTLD